MYDFQISSEVAQFLTDDGVRRLKLGISSRRLTCSVCSDPLEVSRALSVLVTHDPHSRLMMLSVAHGHCARSEIRTERLEDRSPDALHPGHEWNLVLRSHPSVPAIIAWEPRLPFDGPSGPYRRRPLDDPVAAALWSTGFRPAVGRINHLLPQTACRVAVQPAGADLSLLRDGRRWIQFSGAVRQESQRWLEAVERNGRALLLYGPALGGEALTHRRVCDAVASGMTLAATVRFQPSTSAERSRRCIRWDLARRRARVLRARRPRRTDGRGPM